MRISLIISAYNEEKILPYTLIKLHSFIKNQNDKWEVIFVDDGSLDNTLKILKEFKPRFFKIISYKPNRGKGYAIRKGVEKATGDYVGFTDSDLPYPLEDLKKAFLYLKDFDIVIGSRNLVKINKVKTSLIRKIYGRAFNLLSKIILSHNISDTQCGMKVFRTEVAKDLFSRQLLNRFAFDIEVLYIAKKQNYRIKELPAVLLRTHSYRKSKVSLIKDPIRMFLDLIRIKINHLSGKYEQSPAKF